MKKTLISNCYIKSCLTLFVLLCFSTMQAQSPKGKLFIIGGGDRSDELMTQ